MTGPNVGYATITILPSMRGFESAVNRQLGPINTSAGTRAGQQLGDATVSGYSRSMDRIRGIATKAAKATAIGVGVAAGAFVTMGVRTAAAMEQAQIGFETMLGSAERAKGFLDQLKAFAAETPFEFPELQTAASSLIAAGVEADKVIPIMTTLGDVTAGMGTGSEGVKRATIALQQMQAAGKITAEDLNQLRDAGIPVFDLLAAATGKAKEEVTALASAGKLGREELDQLMAALESGDGLERFSGLMEKQAQSLPGLWSTFYDELQMGAAEAMEPLMAIAKDAMPAITEATSKGLEVFSDGLVRAIDLGEDLWDRVEPSARGLGRELGPTLQNVGDIAMDVVVPGLQGGAEALAGLFAAATPVVAVVGDLTGFLADHEEITWAVVGAYAGWKATLAATAAWATATTAVTTMTTSLTYLRGAIGSIAATRGISSLAALPGVINASVSGMGAGVGVAGGFAGAIAGGVIAMKSLERSTGNAHEAVEAFMDGLDSDAPATGRMQSITAEIERLESTANRSSLRNFTQLINPFESNSIHEARTQITALGGELDSLAGDYQAVYDENRKWMDAASVLGIEAKGIKARFGDLIDIDIASSSAQQVAAAIREQITPQAELLGLTLDEAVTIDPEVLEANEKAVKDSMEAVGDAYRSYFDVLQLKDESVDPKQLDDARERVTLAEQAVREAQEEARMRHDSADDAERAAGALTDAQRGLQDARDYLAELEESHSPLNKEKIEAFYEDMLSSTAEFSANIQEALAQGYDPAYVSRLLQAGPEEAGPVLEVLVSDTTQSFVDMVNSAEEQLSELTGYAVEAQRLTQMVINDQSENGQQMATDLAAAITISQEIMRTGAATTMEELAELAGVSVSEVQRVMDEFNLKLDEIDAKDVVVRVGVEMDPELALLLQQQQATTDMGSGSMWIVPASRWGNVFEYAQGGFGAGIYQGTIHKFAEPETGGEAYIPRLGAVGRSEALMGHIARDWFGGQYVTRKELDEWRSAAGGMRMVEGSRVGGGRPRTARRRRQAAGATPVVNVRGADTASVVRELAW